MLKQELKKIWQPWLLTVLALLALLIGYLFMAINMRYGGSEKAYFAVHANWLRLYGETLEDEEFEAIGTELDALYREADGYIAENELFAEKGVFSYEDWLAFENECWEQSANGVPEDGEAWESMSMYLLGSQTDQITFRIQAVENTLESFDGWQTGQRQSWLRETQTYAASAWYRAAAEAAIEGETWRNNMPYMIPENTSDYFCKLLVLIVLSVALLCAPALVSDRAGKMRPLQWSSVRGRRVIGWQLGAALLSAAILVTVWLFIFGGLFCLNRSYIFWNCRLQPTAVAGSLYSPNCTYGAYCVILALLCYPVGLGTGALAFFLARYSDNYVGLLLKLIPACLALALACLYGMKNVFSFYNPLRPLISEKIPLFEVFAPVLLFLGAAGAALAVCLRTRRQELLLD